MWGGALRSQGAKALISDRDVEGGEVSCVRLSLGAALPAGAAPPERFWPLDEVRAIVLTSGTTGVPRAVRLTTAQLLFSAMGSAIRLGHHLDDRWLACLPFHHVGGLSMIVRCTWLGITLVLHERFDAHRVAAALDRGDATLVSLVPVMLSKVLDARDDVPLHPALRVVLLGGAPASRILRERCEALKVPLAITWGMSEAASQVATRLVGGADLAVRADSGPVMPFARVSMLRGGLQVQGPLVEGGVLQTQDVGRLDSAGRVTILGRADDVILSGGENIMPREIETILRTHPGVEDVAVLGREDATWGQRPIAFIVWRDDTAREDDTTLRAWCRERMARFKVPDAFVARAVLPRNTLGKLDRQALRAALEEVP